MNIGQIFNASSKVRPEGVIYRNDGIQPNELTPYNIRLIQIINNDFIMVECEWFNQRIIKVLED